MTIVGRGDTGSQGKGNCGEFPRSFASLAELPPSPFYRNVLLESSGAGTIENETPSRMEATAWLDGWLDEPLGLVPAIVPPAAVAAAESDGAA